MPRGWWGSHHPPKIFVSANLKKKHMNTKELGENLKFYRERLGVSLYRINVRTGLRMETSKRIEAGQDVTLSSLLLYLTGLGVHMELFPDLPAELSGIDPESPEEKIKAWEYWTNEFEKNKTK